MLLNVLHQIVVVPRLLWRNEEGGETGTGNSTQLAFASGSTLRLDPSSHKPPYLNPAKVDRRQPVPHR